MKADEVESALEKLREVIAEAGATAAAKDIAALARLMALHRGEDFDSVLRDIELRLDPAANKQRLLAQHLETLQATKLDEAAFKVAFAALRQDKAITKDDILDLAKSYGVIRIGGRSREAALECIEKHFYWLLYNRDADAMAKRATPW